MSITTDTTELKKSLVQFLKETEGIDPHMLIMAAHNPKNVRYVWYYDDASKDIVGSMKSTSHDSQEFANISSKDDAIRGRVFDCNGKTILIIYGLIASNRNPSNEEIRDIYLKVTNNYPGHINYTVDELGHELTNVLESK